MSVVEDQLRQLLMAAPRSADQLLTLLLDGLDWPITDGLTWDDLQLEWEPEELHLDPEKVAKLNHISQLPQLTTNQTFGVWVLEFDGGRLPIGAIRRVVQRLVRNERARKGSGRHAQWALGDLLFFCLSEGQENLLHVVNFREKDGKRLLNVMSWSDNPTKTRLDLLVQRGVPDLFWQTAAGPKIVLSSDLGSGFHGYRQGIKSAATLSRRMAEVAQDVRDEIQALYDVETAGGPIRTLFNEVRAQLLSNLQPDGFADVYAQTMVYGLLTARIAHPEEFKAARSLTALKFDNEFLDAIYARFRDDSDSVIDVDELGLNDLAEELAATDVDELLADFGADNQRDDPVVYFYEEFLAQYDPEQRKNLGAFYTPLPVVRYIVKTVDDALRSFGLPLGVADSTTWAQYITTRPEIDVPKLARPEDAVVSMFDPANGTGTFLVEWMRQARRNGGSIGEASALAHSSACEISLASYAVSHLKVSLEVAEGLREKSRLPIYLGDTLGKRHPQVIEELADPISIEGAHADEVKFEWNHNVLIGNPPYDRVKSSGTGGFITAMQDGSKRSLFDDIYGPAVQNTNFAHVASLYNLYVYFWRFAIWKAFEENTGPAVVSMITASSWLEGPGFLGLRRLAREVADEIIVVDLHGNNKGARKDENVFDIESPVAIVTLVRHGRGDRTVPASVRYASCRGGRAEKLALLTSVATNQEVLEFTDASTEWYAPLIPTSSGTDWKSYPALVDLLPWQQPGCKFGRTWPLSPAPQVLALRWKRLISSELSDDRATCFVTPSAGRNIYTKVGALDRIADLKSGTPSPPVVRYGYRSFDRQWAFQDPRMAKTESPSLWWAQSDRQVMITTSTRQLGLGPAVVATAYVPDLDYFNGRGGKDVIPLYRDAKGTPNADPALLKLVTQHHLRMDSGAKGITGERLFAYVTGVLAGADYTERFHSELDTAGTRIPLTADPERFDNMATHGERLIWLQTFGERFGDGTFTTNGVAWSSTPTELPSSKADVVFDSETATLRVADGVLTGIPEAVWTFEVSGMKVIPKWLGYRMVKPAGKAGSSRSPLDKIRPTAWAPEWSTELVEVVSAIKQTLALIPDGVTLLEDIISGPLISANELPPVPLALRQPPKVRASIGEENVLFGDDGEGAS
ncbi:type ISP restriction/modification enzyme [Demequina oxidasica]|uniref:type ISP restriction/modification enzyme n=1 Tax=Demequina oxidasica TaxID=676199 RepID=UPI000781855C|nr:type ISP restriction/modification enzyme [Demequina oxidasica]